MMVQAVVLVPDYRWLSILSLECLFSIKDLDRQSNKKRFIDRCISITWILF